MTTEPTGAPAGLIERVMNILTKPQTEFDKIETETASTPGLIMGYVLPLAAIGAIAGFIGMSLIGAGAFGISYRVPMVPGLVTAAVHLGLAIAGVFVMSFIINALAPSFGSRQDPAQAMKLAAHYPTAAWVAGIFAIYPPLGPLGILGLYSLFLLYIGLPRLMKTPEDKRIGYFLTIIVISIVVWVVIGAVAMAVQGSMWRNNISGPGFTFGQSGSNSSNSSITVNGNTVDLSEMERAANAMSAAVAGSNSGGAAATTVSTDTLSAMLAPSMGGMTRVSLSSSSGGAIGMGASEANATYNHPSGAVYNVTVVSLGAMGGLTAMAGAMNVQSHEENEDGYTDTRTQDGRLYNESISRSSGSVSVGITGRNGMAVTVDGRSGATIDSARAIALQMIQQAESAAAG
jgi:hypothetical protein